jgi:cytochrome b561
VSLLNGPGGYGALTKALHWSIAVLFAFQYVAASVMTRIGPADTALGLSQASWFNGHKTIGLIALGFAVMRLLNRRLGELPPWAPTLSEAERHFIHRAEQVLYAAMLVMPISGFVYVMAGGYGVLLFGRIELPNPIGAWPTLASLAKWLHIAGGWVLLAALAGHIGLVLRHQFVLGDGLLRRMLFAPRPPD